MDNQGDWLPSSKLVHIKPGRFFNHYTNPPGPFDDQPVTQPVVWVPQNEIGNSPSTPVQLSEGPFAGQMLFGDVTYGGVQRAFLEEVDGEYQGAVFRHTAGLEAGVNRLRPITMTTLAAILALTPLALAIGGKASMERPLAIAIIAGLIAQGPLVLLAMPAVYSLLGGARARRVRSA